MTHGARTLLTPPLPDNNREAILALARHLEESQFWPPGTLLTRQLEQLERLLAHAAAHVPFYRQRLAFLGEIKPGSLTLGDIQAIPLLRRGEIQERSDEMTSADLPPGHAPTGMVKTSGSTGRPVTIITSLLTGIFFSALNLRYHSWFKRDFSKSLAMIQTRHRGQTQEQIHGSGYGRWSPAGPSGPVHFLPITEPIRKQLQWLQDVKPSYLLTHPTNLRAMLEQAEEDRIHLPNLLQVSTNSEILEPETRAACERIWGVPLTDCYSSRETGMTAIQCPDHDHYHVSAENIFFEILDDDGRPCPPGQGGRVVLTDLHNFSMPLIRYEIGDYAEAGPPCDCGRGLPVVRRIVGRVRNMLVLPDGDRMWPSFPNHLFSAIETIRQYQLIQKTPKTIQVNIAASEPLTRSRKAALRQNLRDHMSEFPYRFIINQVDGIPRSAGGKYEDFISEIA